MTGAMTVDQFKRLETHVQEAKKQANLVTLSDSESEVVMERKVPVIVKYRDPVTGVVHEEQFRMCLVCTLNVNANAYSRIRLEKSKAS